MFVIKNSQMLAFQDDIDNALVKIILAHLQKNHYDSIKMFPEYLLKEMIIKGIVKARICNFTLESTIGIFIALMFAVSPNFYEYEKVKKIFSCDVSEERKISLLLSEILDLDWEYMQKNYNVNAWFE